jgi:hypothetical protein
MPSGKLLAWMAVVSVAVTLGIEHYKKTKGG